MIDPLNFKGESVRLGSSSASTLTLIQGSAFCISGGSGDILHAEGAQGLIYRDTRFLSRCEMHINGTLLESLGADAPEPFQGKYISRFVGDDPEHDRLLVIRNRFVGRGMREDVTVRNYGSRPYECTIELLLDADFAELFAVKEGRAVPTGHVARMWDDGIVDFAFEHGDFRKGCRISFDKPAQSLVDGVYFEATVPAGGEWGFSFQVTTSVDGKEVEPRYRVGQEINESLPHQRLERWRREIPPVETDHDALEEVMHRSSEDLGALRLFDPDHPARVVVAAGAPWFMTLFGRDSLLVGWMTVLYDPEIALGVLQTLAEFQGDEIDPSTEEEPGRIIHEIRFGESTSIALSKAKRYYGSADATPLFVMLLGELQRWGIAPAEVERLMPHAERAMEWIEKYGDRDGDGYIEYQRATPNGLLNQGWKDSWDGIRFADGSFPETPIALAEVQAYLYGAYLAMAHFAQEANDRAKAIHYAEKAAQLKVNFNRDFWLADKGYFAVALDRNKKPIDSITSNIGHCMWTGIVDEDKASAVAKNMLSDAMFSGWGIRTLSRDSGGYDPLSYHCGSVWPHDTAIAAAGLMRYGFVDEAQKVAMALIESGAHNNGRLPELFAGVDRSEFNLPISYPTSCSPQAWSAAAPLLILRSLLRLDVSYSQKKVWLDPVLPASIHYLKVERIPLGRQRLTVEVENGTVKVAGLSREIELLHEPRVPETAFTD